MRVGFLCAVLSISLFSAGQVRPFVAAGIDFRQYPIDIEDQPRGALPPSKGLPPDDRKFWNTLSLQGTYGIQTTKHLSVDLTLYARHNLLHRIEGVNHATNYPKKPAEKKNFKYDLFLDVEKKIQLRKNKERYFSILAGMGLTNINSHFDITLTDTTESGNAVTKHYQGDFLHFSSRISIGYQYEKLKASLNAFVIEGPDRTKLTSLWLGASISYEWTLRKKNTGRKH